MSELTATQKKHQEALEAIKKKLVGGAIAEKLEFKAVNRTKLDTIIEKIEKVISPNKVWNDFNFPRTGIIMGVLRSIAQNGKQRDELLTITGLSQEHIDLYFECIGNLPWVNQNNIIDPGRPMDFDLAKEYLKLVGSIMEYVITDEDLLEISEERWNTLYINAMARAKETVLNNERNAANIPIGGYDE